VKDAAGLTPIEAAERRQARTGEAHPRRASGLLGTRREETVSFDALREKHVQELLYKSIASRRHCCLAHKTLTPLPQALLEANDAATLARYESKGMDIKSLIEGPHRRAEPPRRASREGSNREAAS